VALEVCALVRVTDEALLADALGVTDAHDLFEWLRGLSFIESGVLGLFPHDLAREALVADLRWRNRDWYAELHRRIRGYYTERLETTQGLEQQRVLFDYVFLHRDNPLVRPFLEWQETGTSLPDRFQEGDLADILAMVEEHEGAESAALARYWLERQPEGALIFRDADRRASGFLLTVALERTTPEDMQMDPAVRLAAPYVRRVMPLRDGDHAAMFRFWMARDTYQGVSPIQSILFITIVRYYFTPNLVFSCIPCRDAQFWSPMFAYADLARLEELDFEVGGQRYGVYGHNWRAVPPMAWLALLAEREIAMSSEPPAPTPVAAPLLVLSESDFLAAAQEAVRTYTRADTLAKSLLLRSRLVVERAGSGPSQVRKAAVLRDLVTEACEVLRSSPRDVKLYRAVYHTYISPAPTQEQAAERLDLPFSTYRRHLKEGLARVAEVLWEWETQAPGS
jgi:hypothetical protein